MTSFLLHHLIYVSRASKGMKPSDNVAILAIAKDFNTQHEISGILVYKDQTFLHLLEGPQQAVQNLYRKIRKDERHTDIQTLMNEPTYNRFYPQLGLEFRSLDNTEESKLPPYWQGLNKQYDISSFTQHPEHALRLLVSFRDMKK